MPTRQEILDANSALDEVATMSITRFIRESDRYKAQPGLYPNLAGKLAEANGTVKGQMLNALLDLMESGVGDGTVGIKGGDEGVDYDQVRDRAQVIEEMINTLYDQPVRPSAVATGQISAGGAQCRRCGRWPCVCGYCVWG